MEKFIAFNEHSEDIGDGPVSAKSAAHAMLTYDGFDYEIRQEGDEFKLFVSRNSLNSVAGRAGGYAEWPDYAASTEAGVYENVIRKGGVGKAYAMTESEYAAMLANPE